MEPDPSMKNSLSRLRERAGVRARALRHDQTNAEALLWHRLRNRQLLDLKFRRQRPIGKYIADFACLEIGLVIELDGGQHVEQVAYDKKRELEMRELGFRTLRFWDHEVLKETEAVMEKIRQVAEALTLTPALSRKRERE
jgi:very-short-patch-repair endonuclease